MPAHKRTTLKIFRRAIELRANRTEAETRLWAYLRGKKLDGVKFRRQHAVGDYIVDFCAPRRKLIIELDGGGHLEREEYDAQRTHFLELRGYKVLRFWNNDVKKDLDAVIGEIQHALEDQGKSPGCNWD